MNSDEIRIRELDVAEKRATADAAVAVALQAIAQTVRELDASNTASHSQHRTKIEENSNLLVTLVAQMDARAKLWERTLDLLGSKPFLVGLVGGVAVTVVVLGPIIMTALAPGLTSLVAP